MRGTSVAALVFLSLALTARAQEPAPPEGPVSNFGVTVVDAYGLHGEIYLIKPGSRGLPNFKKLKPVGSIYTYALNIPPTDFTAGFPGVTDRFEWFAIDYHGSFWIAKPGEYRFLLASDDGSKLSVDGKNIIDNNGLHPIVTKTGRITLT
ncbi:MAG: PA14 domain-containing protein, partial [Acidobacteriota bacterium]|nr:PA14 domain-containing protein [Acidobacteriota bacterium]